MRSHLGNVTLAGLHDVQAAVEPSPTSFWDGMQSTLQKIAEPVMSLIPTALIPPIKDAVATNIPIMAPTTIPTPKPTALPAVDPNDVRAAVEEAPSQGPNKLLLYGGISLLAVGGVLLLRRRRKGRRS